MTDHEAYVQYIQDNLERIGADWQPISFQEFLGSEERANILELPDEDSILDPNSPIEVVVKFEYEFSEMVNFLRDPDTTVADAIEMVISDFEEGETVLDLRNIRNHITVTVGKPTKHDHADSDD